MRDPRIEPLEELATRLEALVSTLGDSETPHSAGLERAWSQVDQAFERFRQVWDAVDEGPLPEEVRVAMEAVLRLDAVAVGLASRQREGMALELEKMSGARARRRVLESARGNAGTGDSCDITG